MNWKLHNLVIYDKVPVFELIQDLPIFPAVSHAREDGLLAVGGDLSESRLVEAYRNGIFP